MTRKLTREHYKTIGRDREIHWIPETRELLTSTKTWWECARKHKWKTSYDSIRGGSGCPFCRRVSSDKYHELAVKQGIKWIGIQWPKDVVTKTQWECKKKHKWETTFSHIRRGTKCPLCYWARKKLTQNDFETVGKGKGIRWIPEKQVPSSIEKTLWQCGNNHQWEATYDNVRRVLNCPICWRISRHISLEDYHGLAKSKNFQWLGNELPCAVSIKTLWKCKNDHQWEARYNDIKSGHGCPDCW